MTGKEHAGKAAKVGGYTILATSIAQITPGLKDLPLELSATAVAIVLRAVEAIVRRKLKFDIFG